MKIIKIEDFIVFNFTHAFFFKQMKKRNNILLFNFILKMQTCVCLRMYVGGWERKKKKESMWERKRKNEIERKRKKRENIRTY